RRRRASVFRRAFSRLSLPRPHPAVPGVCFVPTLPAAEVGAGADARVRRDSGRRALRLEPGAIREVGGARLCRPRRLHRLSRRLRAAARAAYSVCSLPPCGGGVGGGGWGGGWRGDARPFPQTSTPTPNPSPQGGGESTEVAAREHSASHERAAGEGPDRFGRAFGAGLLFALALFVRPNIAPA